jgi:uncharacterized protein YbjT (DUF2867 family)
MTPNKLGRSLIFEVTSQHIETEMKDNKVIVLGATGLVGKELVKQLLLREDVSTVTCLLRRTTGISNPKLHEVIVDFDKPSSFSEALKGDVLFSAFGTTIKKAGSQDAQYKIDYTYQYQVAKAAKEAGVKQYVLISSVGANADSSMFYNRIKGELDRDVQKLKFDQIAILRPSVLAGKREESRPAEKAGIWFGKYIIPLIPYFRKFRAIPVSKVAAAMIGAWTTQDQPVLIREADALFRLADAAKD